MTESQWNDANAVFNILFLILSAVFLVLYSESYVEIKHNKSRSGITLYVRLVMNTSILSVMAYFIRYIIASTFHDLLTDIGDGATKFETTMKDSLFIIGHSVFYLVMVLRLYFVFKGSKYALSRMAEILLASFWIGIMVINIVYSVILRKNSSDTHYHSVFFFMLAVLDTIDGAVLL